MARKFSRNRSLELRSQADRIKQYGRVATFPCFSCAVNFDRCVMGEKSKRCEACTRFNRKCSDRLFSEDEWARQHKEEARVSFLLESADSSISFYEAELEKVLKRADLLRQNLSRSLARHSQLRRLQQVLRSRGEQMSTHDVQTSERLDSRDPSSVPPPSEDSAESLMMQLDPQLWDVFPDISLS